jgi:cyclopropane fatty-acyl-phospholipid synthase-like methyltransferase
MVGDSFLHHYFLNNGGKRLHKWLHYFDIYERHFHRFRSRPITMLEIGVHGGGSLAMWKAYFHADSRIVGIDINPECAKHAGEGIEVRIGSQDDAGFLTSVADEFGPFDVILDDGSHVNSHVITTFETLYSRVTPDGVFMVEDMHTSYWPKWGGGLRTPGTFIEYAKDRIDELNAPHTNGELPIGDFTKSTDSMSFYDSIVVFEKRPQGHRQHVKTGALT